MTVLFNIISSIDKNDKVPFAGSQRHLFQQHFQGNQGSFQRCGLYEPLP